MKSNNVLEEMLSDKTIKRSVRSLLAGMSDYLRHDEESRVSSSERQRIAYRDADKIISIALAFDKTLDSE